MSKNTDLEDLIERTIAVVTMARRSKNFIEGCNTPSIATKLDALHEELTPGTVMSIIDHYEGKLAQIRIEQYRADVIKDAIREVVREEIKRGQHE